MKLMNAITGISSTFKVISYHALDAWCKSELQVDNFIPISCAAATETLPKEFSKSANCGARVCLGGLWRDDCSSLWSW